MYRDKHQTSRMNGREGEECDHLENFHLNMVFCSSSGHLKRAIETSKDDLMQKCVNGNTGLYVIVKRLRSVCQGSSGEYHKPLILSYRREKI